jgi:hypothetical protein
MLGWRFHFLTAGFPIKYHSCKINASLVIINEKIQIIDLIITKYTCLPAFVMIHKLQKESRLVAPLVITKAFYSEKIA